MQQEIYKNEKSGTYEELKMAGPPLYGQGDIAGTVETFRADQIVSQSLDASRTALVIVDVQPEYWSDCPAVRKDFPHFPSRIQNLIGHCRSQDTKCIWVRAEYSFERSPWLNQFSRLHKGKIPPVVRPSSRWEPFAEPKKHEDVITKTSWSSTSDTSLLDILTRSGIDTVIVCGLITSVCVQHSAFGIFEAGFRTILITDACADRGIARHEAALALYGDYMYELDTTTSIAKKLVKRPHQPDECIPLGKRTNTSADAMTVVTSSSTSLSTMTSFPDILDDSQTEETSPAVEIPYQ